MAAERNPAAVGPIAFAIHHSDGERMRFAGFDGRRA
jgi:hypothetical protein